MIDFLRSLCLWAFTLLLSVTAYAVEAPQQFADIGDLPLVSGETLYDVRIGYRTAGSLNADRSNVILFTTWFTGSSGDLVRYDKIGPGLLADTDRYYVVAVDALANGVSTSPSNSARQPGDAFPAIAIDDMVNAAHALLTGRLGIDHVHAVMGISMGGMQTFQWIAQYPDFMDKAVPIDGSPKMSSYDLALWTTQEQVMETLLKAGVPDDRVTRLASRIGDLALWTPDWFLAHVAPEDFPAWLAEHTAPDPMDPRDYLAQLRAMIHHDAWADFAADEGGYAGRIGAGLLVVGASTDHMVNPAPGRALAEAVGARYLQIESDCGHIGSSCEAWEVNPVIHAFLDAP